ncbi:MAG: zinc ribbon domain-containing protein [Planctomycetaceae bacterium]
MALAVTADAIRALHRMQRQLSDLREQLEAGPRRMAARTKVVEAAEARVASANDEVRRAKIAADQKQLQLKSAEAKITDLESKLNACKTNREYQTLREQIAADRMATKVLEDEILEALERVDATRGRVPAADGELAAARRGLAEVKAEFDAKAAELMAEVERIGRDLEAAETELPPDSRDVYRRVVKSKGSDGMAAVDGQSCGGCSQQLTGNMVVELSMGRVAACRSCGRLLYLAK